MHRRRPRGRRLAYRLTPTLTLCATLLLAAGATGCGPRDEEQVTARPGSASQAEWTWLQQTERQLGERRTRLAGTPDPRLQKETEGLADEFNRRLVEFLNADPPVQGEPLNPRQKAALRMKSDEEIHLARTYIEQGGDYQRAIDIYKEAMLVDPDNPRLKEELANAEARRYMTLTTFSQAQKGMDQDEVRRLLGQPNLNNVRAYPDRNVVGWFYPRDTSGTAAAVWFHKEDGRLVVYLTDFEALNPGAPPQPAAPPAAATRRSAA
jgi:tetratricopeptide (TPR) repeat protein